MFKLLFILFRAFVTPDDEQIKITYDVCVCVCVCVQGGVLGDNSPPYS